MKPLKKPPHPLYLNPLSKMSDMDFGVLRSTYSGLANSVAGYTAAKARLCARSEVLLPADAHDALGEPTELWRSYEAARVPDQRDLATCVTLYLPAARTLHSAWEEVRDFARANFAVERCLPVHAILHAPGLAGSAHDVHAHLVIAARRLHAWGWGRFSGLCRDAAQLEIYTAWTDHRQRWAARELAR